MFIYIDFWFLLFAMDGSESTYCDPIVPFLLQGTLFEKAGNFTGCIKRVPINGILVDLWSGNQGLHPCGNT